MHRDPADYLMEIIFGVTESVVRILLLLFVLWLAYQLLLDFLYAKSDKISEFLSKFRR